MIGCRNGPKVQISEISQNSHPQIPAHRIEGSDCTILATRPRVNSGINMLCHQGNPLSRSRQPYNVLSWSENCISERCEKTYTLSDFHPPLIKTIAISWWILTSCRFLERSALYWRLVVTPLSNFMVSHRFVARFFLFERYVVKLLFMLLLAEKD